MNGVLRIALTYFAVVPLQRWVVGIGAAMVLIGAFLLTSGYGQGPRNAAVVLLVFGAILSVGITALLGGGSMRAASSRRVTHQLPHGRWRMLLGATLAVTLLAALATALGLVGKVDPLHEARRLPFSAASPFMLFATSWSMIALTWVSVFIVSGSRILSAFVGFLPLVFARFIKDVLSMVPHPLTVLAASMVVWAAFGLWYLRVPSIRRLSMYGAAPAHDPGSKLVNTLQALLGFTRGGLSRARAMQQLLLGPSLFGHFLIGLGWILVAAVMLLVFTIYMSGSDAQGPPRWFGAFIFSPVILVTWASMGFALTRRARILWLRAGLDRLALFRRAERSGLLAGVTALGIVMIAFVLLSLAIWPAHRVTVLLITASLSAYCGCLFYTGMSLTRGWVAVDVMLCAGLLLLFALLSSLAGRFEGQPALALVVPAGITLLALTLRWHARRRWLALDWRVARMLQMPRRA